MKFTYLFNMILAIIFFVVAAFFASNCNNDFIEVVIWLYIAAWSITCICLVQGKERNDTLDEIRNNQNEIIKHLESFHNINVNIK